MFHTMQLTKPYVAKTPCNQLLLIDWFCYVYAQDLFASYQQRSCPCSIWLCDHQPCVLVQCLLQEFRRNGDRKEVLPMRRDTTEVTSHYVYLVSVGAAMATFLNLWMPTSVQLTIPSQIEYSYSTDSSSDLEQPTLSQTVASPSPLQMTMCEYKHPVASCWTMEGDTQNTWRHTNTNLFNVTTLWSEL